MAEEKPCRFSRSLCCNAVKNRTRLSLTNSSIREVLPIRRRPYSTTISKPRRSYSRHITSSSCSRPTNMCTPVWHKDIYNSSIPKNIVYNICILVLYRQQLPSIHEIADVVIRGWLLLIRAMTADVGALTRLFRVCRVGWSRRGRPAGARAPSVPRPWPFGRAGPRPGTA